jgi:AcrR family transcriptional regulator
MAAVPHLRADARRNRERIIAAAAELFAAQGTECQMAEIAKHAGVGNATVFRHFPSKHELVIAIAEQQMTGMLEFADGAAAHDDPTEGLRVLVERLCSEFVRNAALKQMTHTHFDGDDRLLGLRDALLGRLGELVGRCQAAGTVRADVQPIDVVVLVNGVAGAMLGLEEERPGLHQRYLALALAGLSPRAADGELPMEPPTADDLEAAWRRSARLHGRGCS